MSSISKVDVHHHIIPPQIAGNGYGMNGMLPPTWNIETDIKFSNSIGVHTRIFSVSTPGVSHITDPKESSKLARSMNEYCAKLRDENPNSYGFFATIPSLEYTEHAIQEIRYAFDTLKADGVTLFTRYGKGDGYLGHQEYVPIWEELNSRKAVVFIHPINNKISDLFNKNLPMPTFDWPQETGRTAMDMILNRRIQQFPNVKIILSHAGGTLPLLITRTTLISQPEFGSFMSTEDIFNQAKSFYFDLALSGSQEVLPLILGFAKDGHVLFGSDFPHGTETMGKQFAKFIDEYDMDEETRKQVYHGAAEKLFPRLKGIYDAL